MVFFIIYVYIINNDREFCLNHKNNHLHGLYVVFKNQINRSYVHTLATDGFYLFYQYFRSTQSS